jgi:hypothetical protein
MLVFLVSAAFFLTGAPFLIQEGPIPQQVLPYLVGTAGVYLGITFRPML